MTKLKELWTQLTTWSASKGISTKGTIAVIIAFVLGAWMF